MPCCSAACCCLGGLEDCPYITGFQYRHVAVIGVGNREKQNRPKKNESVLRFRFLGATEKPTLKSRFSVGKKRGKPTEKNEFRFSVHKMHFSKQAPSPISLTMDQDRKQLRPLLLLDRAELEWWLSRFSSSQSWSCCVLIILCRKVDVTLCSLYDCMFGGRMRAKENTLTNMYEIMRRACRIGQQVTCKKTRLKKKKNESMYDVRSGACLVVVWGQNRKHLACTKSWHAHVVPGST